MSWLAGDKPSFQLRTLILLILVTLLGLSLRCLAVEHAFVYSDECFTWRICRTPFIEMLQRAGADTLPPAHFVLLKYWMRVFGDSPLALRGPSILAGSLCVPAMYWVVREACRGLPGAGHGALLTAALVAVNAVQVTHSRVARPYPLAAFLALVCTWLLLRALRNVSDALAAQGSVEQVPASGWWIGYGISAGAFCLAHHFALFTLAAHGLFVAGLVIRAGYSRIGDLEPEASAPGGSAALSTAAAGHVQPLRLAAEISKGVAIAAAFAITFYSPWLPVFFEQTQRAHTWFWVPPLDAPATLAMSYQWNVGDAPINATFAALALAGTVLAAAMAIYRAPYAGWLFSLMFGVPWLATIVVSTLLGRPLLQERYLLFANLGLLALFGASFATLTARWAKIMYCGILAAVFAPAACNYVQSLPKEHPAMQQCAAWLKDRYQPGEVITVGLPQSVNIAKYYAHREGFDVDARVYLTPIPRGGQPIHTTSLRGDELLVEGPHQPPAGMRRWWQLEMDDAAMTPSKKWRLLEQRVFRGPPGTREVAGSERVELELWERSETP